jgi:putative hydrolase of the HAD superfamily
VVLLEGVEEVLITLSKKYRLIMATKGDLLDQERKLEKSGLLKYFHHIEVMSDKKAKDYKKLLSHLDIKPDQFLMVGNSLKSDILPLVEIGAHAIHVPFHTTWQHEEVCQSQVNNAQYTTVENINQVLKFIS